MSVVVPFTPGGVRGTDPFTSWLASGDIPAISALQRKALEALVLHAHRYPNGAMSSTEMADVHGMARDSFSPRMPWLRHIGAAVFVCVRECMNKNGKLSPMDTYRPWRIGDPAVSKEPPPKVRPATRLAKAWQAKQMNEDEWVHFSKSTTITAEVMLILWRGMSDEEANLFAEWTGDDGTS